MGVDRHTYTLRKRLSLLSRMGFVFLEFLTSGFCVTCDEEIDSDHQPDAYCMWFHRWKITRTENVSRVMPS